MLAEKALHLTTIPQQSRLIPDRLFLLQALQSFPLSMESPEAPAVLVSLQVDATDKVNFVYLDLDSGKIVAEADASWDLAFKRTVIKQNSNVKTAISTDSTFDAILTAPAEATLAADAPVAGGLETAGLVFHEGLSWYTYDINVHVIYSNNFVYFVKSNSGAEYKLSIKDYYDADRLPAFIQVQYIKVAAAQSTAAVTE
ncbi:MAG: hypothetical protein EOP07_24570 [Proteobacteria bacterium]|nr:MAG: hypothetical protein EOP07_24570 [Pseudomonadota bacterium]